MSLTQKGDFGGKNRVISVIFLMVTVSIFSTDFDGNSCSVQVKNGMYFLKVFRKFLESYYILPLFCIFSNYLYDDITRISTKDVFSIGNGTSFI